MRDLRRAWIFLLEAKQGSSTFSYLLSPGLVYGIADTARKKGPPPKLERPIERRCCNRGQSVRLCDTERMW